MYMHDNFSPLAMILSSVLLLTSAKCCADSRILISPSHSSPTAVSYCWRIFGSLIALRPASMWSSRMTSTMSTYLRDPDLSASLAARRSLSVVSLGWWGEKWLRDSPVGGTLRFGIGTAGGANDSNAVVLETRPDCLSCCTMSVSRRDSHYNVLGDFLGELSQRSSTVLLDDPIGVSGKVFFLHVRYPLLESVGCDWGCHCVFG